MSTDAGVPSAARRASRFATTTPESQKAWRYARAWYFQALRQNVLVSTKSNGADATAWDPPVAATSVPRTSPARSRRSAWSWAP
jgi:hypothetical protein